MRQKNSEPYAPIIKQMLSLIISRSAELWRAQVANAVSIILTKKIKEACVMAGQLTVCIGLS